MFCYQCEQTANGTGCTVQGVCGKDHNTATMQDVLVHVCKGISMYADRAHNLGAKDAAVDRFMADALFVTLTNVNFDPERIKNYILQGVDLRNRAKKIYEDACTKSGKTAEKLDGPATFDPGKDVTSMVKNGEDIGIAKRRDALGTDITSLQEIITYGLKGLSAYVFHAHALGKEDVNINTFIHNAMNMLTKSNVVVGDLVQLALKTGETNLRAMEILNQGHVERYGHPTPTAVRVDPVKGKAILVSGHDLLDLEELLKQTQGKNINIYTHGEMLPANAYPKLKAYKHLVGNYGTAWQNQNKEFDAFPGAILMTTNCIQKPRDTYKGRIFTANVTGYAGVRHLENRNFTPVIEAALAAEGFKEDGPGKTIMVGFGHDAVLKVAGTVIDAVKSGAIKHFFLIGGCDGARAGRNYYTDFAKAVPKDCVILTLACGKYRFNMENFGEIGGIPRLLDVGQCNDAYSAVQIAVALANAFKCGVNDLPLSLVLSWYEQKAAAILLSLLHLGVKNIRLGPTLPAFVSPAVLKVLVDNFNIKPITTVEEDLKAILKK